MLSVSIIIPMYNVARFLHICVQSVLDQNMDPSNFEVLMINDGSPDDSRVVAQELSTKFNFIKVFNQENKGLGGARNKGIENASGKYLIFLDADDILNKNTVDRLIKMADENKVDILEFGANLIDQSGNVITTVAKSSGDQVYSGMEYYKRIKYMNSACNKLYRLSFIKNNKLEFTEKIYREDFEFNTRSFFFAARIMATNVIGASFLQSPNSITRNKNQNAKDKYIRDFVENLQLIKRFKKENELNQGSTQKDYFKERIAVSNLGLFFYMFKNNYSYKAIKVIREELIKKGIYLDDFKVTEKNLNIFRIVMLKNFYLFQLSQPFKKIFKL